MNFRDRAQYKKGREGEKIYIRLCLEAGIIPYEPVHEADVAHPFDMLCVRMEDYSIFLADIKTKPQRHSYPDTGINITSCDEYIKASHKHNARVWLAFIDEEQCRAYGNWLHILMQEKEVEHNGRTLKYPMKYNGIIFFPVESMVTFGQLTEAEVRVIKGLSTRSESHDSMYNYQRMVREIGA